MASKSKPLNAADRYAGRLPIVPFEAAGGAASVKLD